ncbi:hypothetical protein NUW58_g8194 [Xylaria curta]|uniref:Uncharacterized protein n=1 Tax=Xylaria curta TaxID=42375 RepID=A0ACC1NBP0_9PEZI|nr:hypothetical protein NUW58_g8194 [Xylaria curta]
MHYAAESGHTEIVQALIETTGVNEKDNFGRTALHWAAENNRFQVVELLLNAEADTNLQDFSNQTALYRAAWRGWDAIVRLLLGHRAAYHVPDQNGKTALDSAVDNGDPTITELLLTAILEDGENGTNEPAVERVLKSFPNNTWRSFYGEIMLWAARNKHRTVMELLLKKAIQVDDQFEDIGESTAVRSTTGESYLETIEFILEFHHLKPIPWGTVDRQRAQDVLQTALSRPTPDGRIDVVGCLLEAWSQYTRAILSNAAKNGRLSIVNHLLEAGAKPAEYGLAGAAREGHLSIVNRLLEVGAKPTEDTLSKVFRRSVFHDHPKALEYSKIKNRIREALAVEVGE